ncbi:MAG: hypothetical protein MZV64_14070 [Ignavibacteriales bacterium]|nr:hypothetical protein [Ignavibacteriales bacterium]
MRSPSGVHPRCCRCLGGAPAWPSPPPGHGRPDTASPRRHHRRALRRDLRPGRAGPRLGPASGACSPRRPAHAGRRAKRTARPRSRCRPTTTSRATSDALVKDGFFEREVARTGRTAFGTIMHVFSACESRRADGRREALRARHQLDPVDAARRPLVDRHRACGTRSAPTTRSRRSILEAALVILDATAPRRGVRRYVSLPC